MAIRTHALIAVILLTTSIAAAGDLDCPRPDLWARYPRIQQEVTHGLAELPYEMAKFQPETFIAKHPALAKMARSDDWAERIRALKAVAALEDPNGIPLLVQAILDAKDAPAVSNASLNEAMNPLTMWIATRAPRKKFKPLAPLFMHILVRTPDWPAVRCRCLQALGNLAESDWLPLVKELLLSRHPAVTNMGAWVIQQLSSRPSTKIPPLELTLDRNATHYKPSDQEIATIAERIKRLQQAPPEDRDDDVVYYSTGVGWFDNWIPMAPSLGNAPDDNYIHKVRYRHGRFFSLTAIEPNAEPWLCEQAWCDERGAPILIVRHHPSMGTSTYKWGDYERDGQLRRMIELKPDYSFGRATVFDNGPRYTQTIVRTFDTHGQLHHITRFAGSDAIGANVDPNMKQAIAYQGFRIDRLHQMEGHGLAPFYPIPVGPMKPEPNDPPGAMLRIDRVTVTPTAVEQQCRAEVVIRNGDKGHENQPSVLCDDIVIRIYDDRGRLIFLAGSAWSGLKPGESLTLTTDTHSNTLRAAGGKPFLLPTVGFYTMTVTSRHSVAGKLTDSRSVRFYVGHHESDFRICPM